MAHLQPWFPKSDAIQRSQKLCLHLHFKITGAKAATALADAPSVCIFDFDSAGALTTAKIDAFLTDSDSAGSIASTIFDSTSLGSNMLGFVIDMKGQAKAITHMVYTVSTTAGGTPAHSKAVVTAAPAASTAGAGLAVTAGGNIYGRITDGNLDSGTAGLVELEIYFESK